MPHLTPKRPGPWPHTHRRLLAGAALTLLGVAVAAGERSVDITLKNELGNLRLAAGDRASPLLGSRNPTVRNGVAYLGASHSQGDWSLALSPKSPISLHLDSVQGDLTLDLRGLPVQRLDLRQQLGTLDLSLPAGPLQASLNVAQGDVVLRLPPDTGVRLTVTKFTQGSLVMQGRELASGLDFQGSYQSANYATARFKADLTVSMALGNLTVK